MDKREWLKDAKIRLVATVACAISAVIAAGHILGWWAALGVLAAEIAACAAYSVRKLLKKKKEMPE